MEDKQKNDSTNADLDAVQVPEPKPAPTTRKRRVIVVISALLLLVLVGAVLFAYQNKKDDSADTAANSSEQTSSEPQTEETLPELETSTSSNNSSSQYDPAKTAKIENFDMASDSFKRALVDELYFIGAEHCKDLVADEDDFLWGNYYLVVTKMVRDEFAGVHFCGSGATSVYVRIDGEWRLTTSLAEPPQCKTVDEYKISREITTTCYLPDGTFREVTYP